MTVGAALPSQVIVQNTREISRCTCETDEDGNWLVAAGVFWIVAPFIVSCSIEHRAQVSVPGQRL